MSEKLQVVTLLGSLRKGSFNGMVARTLPKIAPASMEVNALPSIADIPLYDAEAILKSKPTIGTLRQSTPCMACFSIAAP